MREVLREPHAGRAGIDAICCNHRPRDGPRGCSTTPSPSRRAARSAPARCGPGRRAARRGYEQMTDLPAALRERLAARVPFSSLQAQHEAVSRDGTVKVLFATADGAPARGGADALPRRAPLAVPLLAVGLPADVPLLRDRRDEVRTQPVLLGDPRPGAAFPPHRSGRPLRVHGHGRADAQPRRGAGGLRAAARPRHHAPPHHDLHGRLDPRHRSGSPRAGCRCASRSRCTPPRKRCAAS